MRRAFYFQDDRSNTYWTIELDGTGFVTSHGRLGSAPRETRQRFDTVEEAERAVAKRIASKQRKGYVEGEPSAYEPPEWATLSMSDEVFWRLVGLLSWKRTGDDDAVIEPLVHALAAMPEREIQCFDDVLAEKLHALDTEAHAREVGEGAWGSGDYFSADFFLYTRAVVVANGRAFFENVLADPTAMPKDMEFEALLYVADAAFTRKTGREYEYHAPTDFETFANKDGWKDAEFAE